MKVTRRSENGKSGRLLISAPASRVAEVEAALTFLEGKRQQRGSQVVIDLIVRSALRRCGQHVIQRRFRKRCEGRGCLWS